MQIKVTSKNITITAEGNTQKEVFEQLSDLQEVFTGEDCGLCKGDTRFLVREVDGNKFYELMCNKCFAKLQFGQSKTGGKLFPVRFQRKGKDYVKDSNGRMLEKGTKGWEKYKGKPNAADLE